MKKIYYIIGAIVLGILVVPEKINTALLKVMDSIKGNYDSIVDQVLSRAEFKLTYTEKQLFSKRIKSIIATESRGNKDVKNGSAGEIGIMQIKPAIAKSVAAMYSIVGYDLKIPADNILIGSLLLYDNYKKSEKDLDWATQRYNQGWVEKSNIKSIAYLSIVKGYEDYV